MYPLTKPARLGPVLLVRNAAAYDFGGAERLVVHIAEDLRRQGIDAIVVSGHKQVLAYAKQQRVGHQKGWWWSRQNWDGYRVSFLPVYLVWQFILMWWYVALILKYRACVVHLVSKDDFIAGTIATKLLGRKVIWTDCADLKHIYANHDVWYKNPIGKLVYVAGKLADHVTLVSFSEKRLIEASLKRVTPPHYTVIHLAGRDETVAPIERDVHDKNAVIFCATSRLVIAKGILELIDAFQSLARSSNIYRLWLVGDGPDRPLCEERAAGNTQIIFWGHQEKPLGYLAASNVYVHPTHHEAFSLSLTEAAMLGKPMIASNVGGNPELVNGNNGILFPVHDVSALEAAMQRLGADGLLRERLGKNARHDYINNFDFGVLVKNKLIPLYEK